MKPISELHLRIFLAGATGTIGFPLLRILAAGGHQVVGTTRSSRKLDVIRKTGAEAVLLGGLDVGAVRSAVEAFRPDVIVHQMTALSGMRDLRQFDLGFAETNRLRTEGLDHLIDAARAVGCKKIVAQSFCGWPYARVGGPIKTEEDPLDDRPPNNARRTLEALRHVESLARDSDLEGVVLRYGVFYGPNTGILHTDVLGQIRRRSFPLFGNGGGWWSFVHADDAASATAIAVEHASAGLYNVVDDHPAPVSEWLPVLAEILGAKGPWRLPRWLARLVAGEQAALMMTQSRAGSNAKFKAALGWRPNFGTWTEGFRASLSLSKMADVHRLSVRPCNPAGV